MITTSDIRKGLCIRYSNDIYKIIEFLHVKPGKGPAFVRTKLKSVSTGKVVDNTFTAGHKIDDVRVENRKYQFLYKDGETYHFMNSDDYNQIEVDKSQIESDIRSVFVRLCIPKCPMVSSDPNKRIDGVAADAGWTMDGTWTADRQKNG